MTVRVRFLDAGGGFLAECHAASGARLLDVAQAAGLPLEGSCNGQMACSTCHLVLAPGYFERLPPASPEEDDLLDLAPGVTRFSRLSCQIRVDPALGALTARLPAGS